MNKPLKKTPERDKNLYLFSIQGKIQVFVSSRMPQILNFQGARWGVRVINGQNSPENKRGVRLGMLGVGVENCPNASK